MKKLTDQLDPINETIADLRNTINHPLLLQYSEIFREVLVKAPICHGRMSPGLKINIDAPFYLAAKEYFQEEDGSFDAMYDILSGYYNHFQPKSIAGFFNIKTSSNKLLLEPPWAGILPWRARSLEAYKDTIKKGTLKDNMAHGLEQGIEDGWAYCGPVNKEKCHVETKRLFDLVQSISQKGYIRNDGKDGDVIATALINEEFEWRWLVTNGYHRACVLAAMGFESIVIRVNLVIRRSDTPFWPHVLDGLYSEQNARQIFDNIFQ